MFKSLFTVAACSQAGKLWKVRAWNKERKEKGHGSDADCRGNETKREPDAAYGQGYERVENIAQGLSDNVRGKLMPRVPIRFICALLELRDTAKVVIWNHYVGSCCINTTAWGLIREQFESIVWKMKMNALRSLLTADVGEFANRITSSVEAQTVFFIQHVD